MNRQAKLVLAIALVVLLGAAAVVGIVVSNAGVIAELVSVDGTVQSQHGRSPWASAPSEERYRIGDAVRTGERSTARVKMRLGGGIELRPRTTVRFSAARPGSNAPAIRVEQGEVELEAESPLAISSGGATVRIDRGARVRLAADGAVLRVSVEIGRAVIERDGATNLTIAQGSTADLPTDPNAGALVDSGIIAREPDAQRQSATDPLDASTEGTASDASTEGTESDASTEDSDAAGDAIVSDGPSEARPTSPVFSSAAPDLGVAIAESASVHAPVLPVHIRVDPAARCPAGGSLAVTVRGVVHEQRVREAAVLALPSGTHSLRFRCDGSSSTQRSTIEVDAESGAAALPSRPATSEIALDGHDYTVLYQNHLPILRVSWPRAPGSSDGYALVWRDGRGRESSLDASSASVTLESGRVRDGTIRLTMRANSGAARSPETAVTVQFDNDANAAQIRAPRPGDALTGTVHVEGTALEGSTVTVSGQAMELDSQRRFQGEIAIGDAAALVVMIRHRSSRTHYGTHYYVRRVSP